MTDFLPHDKTFLWLTIHPLTVELFGNPSVAIIARELQAEIANTIYKGSIGGFMLWLVRGGSPW
jgi:hypothetical protein